MGAGQSADELAALVYNELRRLAGAYMRRERPGQTLQATALVHEAYLRLADAGAPWKDERHFVGIAARSMRQILVERARARGAQKRWGGLDRVSLVESLVGATREDAMLPALDDAARVLLLRKLLAQQPVAQDPQLVAIQVADESARKLRRRANRRPDAVLLNRFEHILPIDVISQGRS